MNVTFGTLLRFNIPNKTATNLIASRG